MTRVLADLRDKLAPFYSDIGRPSIDPELMLRMLMVGYFYGIRFERQLCQEVELHLAYRWFCRLDLDDPVPDHSTFSVNRHGRFRDSDILRQVFEAVVRACMDAGLVKGEGFAVDASVIEANASRYHGKAPDEIDWSVPERQTRAAAEFLAGLEDEDSGDNRNLPKVISPVDPCSAWIVGKEITPHIPVRDFSQRDDGTFSRSDFKFDKDRNIYVCPAGKLLKTTGRVLSGYMLRYTASTYACGPCPLKSKCCPNTPQRIVPRDVNEDVRDHARALMGTPEFDKSRDERKKVEMRFAHLKTHHRFERMRLRGLSGARDEFHLAAIVQNLKTLANYLWRPPPNMLAAYLA